MPLQKHAHHWPMTPSTCLQFGYSVLCLRKLRFQARDLKAANRNTCANSFNTFRHKGWGPHHCSQDILTTSFYFTFFPLSTSFYGIVRLTAVSKSRNTSKPIDIPLRFSHPAEVATDSAPERSTVKWSAQSTDLTPVACTILYLLPISDIPSALSNSARYVRITYLANMCVYLSLLVHCCAICAPI